MSHNRFKFMKASALATLDSLIENVSSALKHPVSAPTALMSAATLYPISTPAAKIENIREYQSLNDRLNDNNTFFLNSVDFNADVEHNYSVARGGKINMAQHLKAMGFYCDPSNYTIKITSGGNNFSVNGLTVTNNGCTGSFSGIVTPKNNQCGDNEGVDFSLYTSVVTVCPEPEKKECTPEKKKDQGSAKKGSTQTPAKGGSKDTLVVVVDVNIPDIPVYVPPPKEEEKEEVTVREPRVKREKVKITEQDTIRLNPNGALFFGPYVSNISSANINQNNPFVYGGEMGVTKDIFRYSPSVTQDIGLIVKVTGKSTTNDVFKFEENHKGINNTVTYSGNHTSFSLGAYAPINIGRIFSLGPVVYVEKGKGTLNDKTVLTVPTQTGDVVTTNIGPDEQFTYTSADAGVRMQLNIPVSKKVSLYLKGEYLSNMSRSFSEDVTSGYFKNTNLSAGAGIQINFSSDKNNK